MKDRALKEGPALVAAQAQIPLVPTAPVWHVLAPGDFHVPLVVLYLVRLSVPWWVLYPASVFHLSVTILMLTGTPKHNVHTRYNCSIGHFFVHQLTALRYSVLPLIVLGHYLHIAVSQSWYWIAWHSFCLVRAEILVFRDSMIPLVGLETSVLTKQHFVPFRSSLPDGSPNAGLWAQR